ncbi:hypothetical protein AYO38_03375 [bacterium SCGC AG-212-C10]|nr:hypothetical protein AYO38_03375 [bacterium SCGC AG-212-C10]
MPPITLHMVLADQIARDLGSGVLDASAGPYLIGATTPDIRVLTRQDRFSTHFFDLNVHDHQDSVQSFLASHGRFLESDITAETRSFAAGYITHLVMDEQYITGIYRPYFARHDDLGGEMRANVMDRLLQFDLDRKHGSDPALKARLCEALACTVEDIEAGFVDSETLDHWRGVALDMTAKDMDWERMRRMISNHLRYSGLKEGETLTEFLDTLPELLDETIAFITSTEIDAFVQRSTEAARSAVERYLECG